MSTVCVVLTFGVAVLGVSATYDVLSLLQTGKIMHRKHHQHLNKSSLFQNPGQRERQLCPHEMEELEEKQEDQGTPFGCRGKLRASSVRECSWWGEPHMSSTFVTPDFGTPHRYDVFFKPGHFRLAKAKDNSWDIQAFNCGVWSSALAVRFGKDVFEFISSASGQNTERAMDRYINGKLVTNRSFPIELPSGVFIDDQHREARDAGGRRTRNAEVFDSNDAGILNLGACLDDGNSGQVYFEMGTRMYYPGLSMLLAAAEGSYSTDQNSLCNHELNWRNIRNSESQWENWNLEVVKPEESLFTVGNRICEACDKYKWWNKKDAGSRERAQSYCASRTPVDFAMITIKDTCKEKGIELQTAKNACVHLKDNDEFYKDCQLDFCASGGLPGVVEDVEDEMHLEHPAPECVNGGVGCDPAKVCCDAKKNNMTLNLGNVGTNNLCGDGGGSQELRYTSVLSGVDLVIRPLGEFKCTKGVTNAQNGADGVFGVITLPVGSETEFEFTYVNAGTSDPKDVGVQPFSFLDLDQGKKGRQRESVEVCGASNAIVTTNTELETSSSGECIRVMSTTRGSGDDNPSDPDDMSEVQRARTVAFTPAGSSFRAKLGISAKGKAGRKFLFSGTSSIACDTLLAKR